MHPEIYERLIEVAKSETTITYGEVAPMAGLDMGNVGDRAEISRILDEISRHEHVNGRPLLSAVVVHAPTDGGGGTPGIGFFKMARAVGAHKNKDDVTFFAAELGRVHRQWRNGLGRK
jgi:hypothetical protein